MVLYFLLLVDAVLCCFSFIAVELLKATLRKPGRRMLQKHVEMIIRNKRYEMILASMMGSYFLNWLPTIAGQSS